MPIKEKSREFLYEVGDTFNFSLRLLRDMFKPPNEFREFVKQSYQVGNRSMVLVGITSFIMGLVLTLQTHPVMSDFGAESLMPGMIATAVIREIAPVITALICAGKVGSRIGAELGSMRVTEQIDAMEVSGTNPMKYIVATRVMATTVMIPILIVYADALGLLGSYVGINMVSDVSLNLYISRALLDFDFIDITLPLIKSVFFGFSIGLIATYKGYHSEGGTEGVGRAANASVVNASLMIFVIDLIAVQVRTLLI